MSDSVGCILHGKACTGLGRVRTALAHGLLNPNDAPAYKSLASGSQLRGWGHSLGFLEEEDLGFWFPQKECFSVILTKVT